jgi:hypothetical protein
MESISSQSIDYNNPPPNAVSILAGLGGEEFLAGLGACNFWYDGSQVTFTLSRTCPKRVRLVTISVEPVGSYKIDCFGWITPGTLSAPRAGSANVQACENLAAALVELTGITALRRPTIH